MVRVWNTELDTSQYTKHKKKDLGIDMARVNIFYIMTTGYDMYCVVLQVW